MPEKTPKIKAQVTGIDTSVIADITKAQTKAMESFSGELEKIASSISILEEKLPKAMMDAMKHFTDEFIKNTAAQQPKAPTGGVSASASEATAASPTGDQKNGPTPLTSTFRPSEGPRTSIKKLEQYGPGSAEAEYTEAAPPGIEQMTDEQLQGLGIDPTEQIKKARSAAQEARKQVARFGQTPRTKLGKITTALESVADGEWGGGFGDKVLDKVLGPKIEREEAAPAPAAGGGGAGGRKPPKPRTGGPADGGDGTGAGGPDEFTPPERGRFIPRFGDQRYTAQDYGKLSSDLLKGAAGRVAGRGPVDEATGTTTGDLLSRQFTAGSKIMDRVSNDVLPVGRMAMDAYRQTGVSKVLGSGPMEFARTNVALGTQQGVDPGTGDLEFGGFGARLNSMLFNAAGRQGAKMKLTALKDARAAGINAEQSMDIMKAVSGLGYNEGTERFDRAKASLDLVQQQYGEVTPQDVQLMDLTTRYSPKGPGAALSDFNKLQTQTFKNRQYIPLDFQDAKADQLEMAQYYRTVGGTAMQGAQTAQHLELATGMQARETKPIMQSGFYQANLALQSGLMPYEAGLATSGETISALRKSIRDVKDAAPEGDTIRINKYGQRVVTTAEERKRAFAANALGINSEQMATVESGLAKTEAAESVQAGLKLKGPLQKGVWSKMRRDLEASGYDRKRIEAIENAGKSDKGIGETQSAEDKMVAKIKEFEGQDTKKLRDAGVKIPGQDQKGGDGSQATVGGVSITLEGDAAKLFKIKSQENKTNSDGGGKSTAQAFLDNPVGSIGDMVSGLF